MKRDVYERLISALNRLNRSRDVSFTTVSVSWDKWRSKKRSFSVECVRWDEEIKKDIESRDDSDEYAIDVEYGEPLGFEVYYRIDGIDTDCCSMSYRLDWEDIKSLREFIDMYR